MTLLRSLMSLVILLPLASSSPPKKLCSNLVPGLKRLNRGVDITTLDMLPLDYSSSHGYRQPVVGFTCNEGKKYSIGEVSAFSKHFKISKNSNE